MNAQGTYFESPAFDSLCTFICNPANIMILPPRTRVLPRRPPNARLTEISQVSARIARGIMEFLSLSYVSLVFEISAPYVSLRVLLRCILILESLLVTAP